MIGANPRCLTTCDRLLDERIAATAALEGFRESAAAAGRDLNEIERAETIRLQTRCVELDGLLTEHEAQTSSARAFADLQARIDANRVTDSRPAPRELRGGQTEHRSPGQLVVESTQFAAYNGRGQMSPVEVTDFLNLEQRALITTAVMAGGITPFQWNNQPPAPAMPLTDAVSVVRVSSGSVEWVETGPDPVAAVVAEGALKPEAVITFTPKSGVLETLAHHVQITRQALEDASYMQVADRDQAPQRARAQDRAGHCGTAERGDAPGGRPRRPVARNPHRRRSGRVGRLLAERGPPEPRGLRRDGYQRVDEREHGPDPA